MTAPARLRFAPSPNGYLHLGHAYSALMNARLAERLGGTLLLRFEDIDTARCRPEYMEAALEDLAWLGIQWQEPVWRQSERFPVYAAALEHLKAEGLVYPCFCSRGDIARVVAGRPDWPRDPDGSPLYPGTCRAISNADRLGRIAAGHKPAWRLDMSETITRLPTDLGWTEYKEGTQGLWIAAQPARWGDTLIGRRNNTSSYHLSVVIDDAAQTITDVVRGVDLLLATELHRALQVLLMLPEPAYHHHRLIGDNQHEKLSKSKGSPSLSEARRAGLRLEDLRIFSQPTSRSTGMR